MKYVPLPQKRIQYASYGSVWKLFCISVQWDQIVGSLMENIEVSILTVDGWDRKNACKYSDTVFTYQLVQDFFHQQVLYPMIEWLLFLSWRTHDDYESFCRKCPPLSSLTQSCCWRIKVANWSDKAYTQSGCESYMSSSMSRILLGIKFCKVSNQRPNALMNEQ